MLNRCLNGHCGNNKQGEGPTSRLPSAGIVKYHAAPLTALIPIPFCMTTDQCVADPAVLQCRAQPQLGHWYWLQHLMMMMRPVLLYLMTIALSYTAETNRPSELRSIRGQSTGRQHQRGIIHKLVLVWWYYYPPPPVSRNMISIRHQSAEMAGW